MTIQEISLEKARKLYANFRALRMMVGTGGIMGILLAIAVTIWLAFQVTVAAGSGALVALVLPAVLIASVIVIASLFVSYLHRYLLAVLFILFGIPGILSVILIFWAQLSLFLNPAAQGNEWRFLAIGLILMVAYSIFFVFLLRFGIGIFSSTREEYALARGSSQKPSNVFGLLATAIGVPVYASRLGGGASTTLLSIIALVFAGSVFYFIFQIPTAVGWVFTKAQEGCQDLPLVIDTRVLMIGMQIPKTECMTASADWTLYAFVGYALVLAALFFISRRIARALEGMVRRRITSLYKTERETNQRAPILYLRAFADDHRRLPRNPHTIVDFLGAMVIEPSTQDGIVLDTATPYGPVVAIGDPDDPIPPFGARRIYAEDANWQDIVRDLISQARAIVISMDETPGLAWEIEEIVRQGVADKTLFLMSPDLTRLKRIEAAKMIARAMRLPDTNIDLDPAETVIAAYPSQSGQLNVLTSKRTGVPTLISAARCFFFDLFDHPKGNWHAPRLRRPFSFG